MDRYGQRQLPAEEKAKVAAARAARTADGDPNLAGDWAAEQRVMSDPRGQLGTLVPLSQAAKMKPGELPAGQQPFPGARGSAASLAADPIRAAWDRPIPVKLTAAGAQGAGDLQPRHARQPAPALRTHRHPVRLDLRQRDQPHRADRRRASPCAMGTWTWCAPSIWMARRRRPARKPSRAGYSVGRWEGDALVVETTHFLPGVLNADSRILHGAKLRITERFELDAGHAASSRAASRP